MKILRVIAVIALVAYSQSMVAAKSKLNKKQVNRILKNARTGNFKTVEADIHRLKKHGNKKAANLAQIMLDGRKQLKLKDQEMQDLKQLNKQKMKDLNQQQQNVQQKFEEIEEPSWTYNPTYSPQLEAEEQRLENVWENATFDREPTQEEIDAYLDGLMGVYSQQLMVS